ncbi:MAG: response regulator [Firmicutes bacterium]|nr:response regulator [Bacillota bacterium]
MIRVLHVGHSDTFRAEVGTYLGRLKDFQYRGTSDSFDLLETIEREGPHVVLLDFKLDPGGGFVTLREIRKKWKSDQVAVVLFSDTPLGELLMTEAADAGADYVVLLPVDLVILEKRIRQLIRKATVIPHKELTLKQVKEICTAYFERMGVPPHFDGYRYLVEGIWLASLHPAWLTSVTQHLYPAIGQRFKVSGAQVERAMRYAIDVTWARGNIDQLYQIFPYVRENKGKPTNSVFIAKMVDLVGLEVERTG